MWRQRGADSFLNCGFLAISGGLQDAYTYHLRGKVFANAQTGNVILMSQNLFQGNLSGVIRYMIPLLAFLSGVFAAEQIQTVHKRKSRFLGWKQWILIGEILILVTVPWIPPRLSILANTIISFSCAMQVQTFRTVGGYGYASTMCIGNMRSGTEALARLIREKNSAEGKKALYYFGIIFMFAIGAVLESFVSERFGLYTILVCPVLLLCSMIMCSREEQ